MQVVGNTIVAALLTVVDYSLNDTIVVFDRIRENFRKMRKAKRLKWWTAQSHKHWAVPWLLLVRRCS